MEDVCGSRFSFINFRPWSVLDFISPMAAWNDSKSEERSSQQISTSVSCRLSNSSGWSVCPSEKHGQYGKTHLPRGPPLLRQPNHSRTRLIDTNSKVVIPARVYLSEKYSEKCRAISSQRSSFPCPGINGSKCLGGAIHRTLNLHPLVPGGGISDQELIQIKVLVTHIVQGARKLEGNGGIDFRSVPEELLSSESAETRASHSANGQGEIQLPGHEA